jgi:hypothetical protein
MMSWTPSARASCSAGWRTSCRGSRRFGLTRPTEGRKLADWCRGGHQQGDGWDLEVVEREPGRRGFSLQPRRWIVERSFAWLVRNRRLAKDYERRVQTSETLIEVAATRLVLRRLAGQLAPPAARDA